MRLIKKDIERDRRVVQGTYITLKSKAILRKEAKKVRTNPTHLASYILEKALKDLEAASKNAPKEKIDENNTGNITGLATDDM